MTLQSEITVAIATLGEGVARIVLPPPAEGVRHVIFVQSPPAVMPANTRKDVTYIALDMLGLSHSRNSAIAQCETDFLVFADDDMTLDIGGLCKLAACLAENPQLGFVAGWREGRLPQTGPRSGRHHLSKRNSGRICAPELMVRLSAIKEAGIRFDTRFGAGARYPVGEDFIFVCDMLEAGLRGDAFPVVTGAHDGVSTGGIWDDARILAARRKVLERCFGKTAPLVRLVYALRHRRQLGGLSGVWRFLSGAYR